MAADGELVAVQAYYLTDGALLLLTGSYTHPALEPELAERAERYLRRCVGILATFVDKRPVRLYEKGPPLRGVSDGPAGSETATTAEPTVASEQKKVKKPAAAKKRLTLASD